MSDKPGHEMHPLSALLFGWAFKPGRGRAIMLGLAAFGALLIADEIFRGRPDLGMPLEDVPGFYAFLGLGIVALIVGAGHLWAQTLGRLPPPDGRP
jgi:hypothetical protein